MPFFSPVVSRQTDDQRKRKRLFSLRDEGCDLTCDRDEAPNSRAGADGGR